MIIGKGQLINVVPYRIFTSGDVIPPTLQALPVFLQQLFVLLKLKSEIESKHSLFIIRVMNFLHNMPYNFVLCICLVVRKTAKKWVCFIVLIEIPPYPSFP